MEIRGIRIERTGKKGMENEGFDAMKIEGCEW